MKVLDDGNPGSPDVTFKYYTYECMKNMVQRYVYQHRDQYRDKANERFTAKDGSIRRMSDNFHLLLLASKGSEAKRFKSMAEKIIAKIVTAVPPIGHPDGDDTWLDIYDPGDWPSDEPMRQVRWDLKYNTPYPDSSAAPTPSTSVQQPTTSDDQGETTQRSSTQRSATQRSSTRNRTANRSTTRSETTTFTPPDSESDTVQPSGWEDALAYFKDLSSSDQMRFLRDGIGENYETIITILGLTGDIEVSFHMKHTTVSLSRSEFTWVD